MARVLCHYCSVSHHQQTTQKVTTKSNSRNCLFTLFMQYFRANDCYISLFREFLCTISFLFQQLLSLALFIRTFVHLAFASYLVLFCCLFFLIVHTFAHFCVWIPFFLFFLRFFYVFSHVVRFHSLSPLKDNSQYDDVKTL